MIMDILVTGTTVAMAYGAGFWVGKVEHRLETAGDGGESGDEDAWDEGRTIGGGKVRDGGESGDEDAWDEGKTIGGGRAGDRHRDGNEGVWDGLRTEEERIRKGRRAGEESGNAEEWEDEDGRIFRNMQNFAAEKKGKRGGLPEGEIRSFAGRGRRQKRLPAGARKITLGRAIGSPVTGEVSGFSEGGKKGVILRSSQGKLYAPVSGKIVKLYPTGNCMLLRTDFGMDLLIRAGIGTEELEGLHYRPRVIQNEVVSKGKLLLEYDPAAIRREGYDPAVILSVEAAEDYREITVSEDAQVKNGEDIMWVRR